MSVSIAAIKKSVREALKTIELDGVKFGTVKTDDAGNIVFAFNVKEVADAKPGNTRKANPFRIPREEKAEMKEKFVERKDKGAALKAGVKATHFGKKFSIKKVEYMIVGIVGANFTCINDAGKKAKVTIADAMKTLSTGTSTSRKPKPEPKPKPAPKAEKFALRGEISADDLNAHRAQLKAQFLKAAAESDYDGMFGKIVAVAGTKHRIVGFVKKSEKFKLWNTKTHKVVSKDAADFA